MRKFLPAFIAALVVVLAYCLPSTAQAHAVGLSQARSAPTWLVSVPAHRTRTVLRQCPHGTWFSEFSAYRWDGSPLPAQRRTGDLVRWGRVTFDGLTWRNHTSATVLVAGWCE